MNDPMVCSVKGHPEESSNSNVISLLEVCFMCNRRFLYEPIHFLLKQSEDQLREEELLLKVFFEDAGNLEKTFLQCCSFCKILCESLLAAKESLSKVIGEIRGLLRKSKKLAPISSYMVPEQKVAYRLFEPSVTETNRNMYLMMESEYSPTKIYDQIMMNSNSSPFSTCTSSTPDKDKAKGFVTIENEKSDSSPQFKLMVPSNSSAITTSTICTGGVKSPAISRSTSTTPLCTPTSTKPLTLPARNPKAITMVANSLGRFVLVEENDVLEENAQDGSHDNSEHDAITFNGVNLQKKEYHPDETNNNDPTTTPLLKQSRNILFPSSKNFDAGNKKTTSVTDTTKPYACDSCPKQFKCSRDLKNHIGYHYNIKPFICEICGASYRHRKGLEMHVAMHRGESKFECKYCQKSFTQKAGLLRHLPLHTGESKFQCDLCGKSFLHHSSFAHHKLTHTGEKKFQCHQCSSSFASSTHLKRHQRRHTGEKPYQCGMCERRFAEKSNMKAHMRIHTKSPPYSCSRCAMSFSRKHKLAMHITLVHSESSLTPST